MKKQAAAILGARILAGILLASLVALACILPLVVESLCGTRDLLGDRANLSEEGQGFILAIAYGMLAVATAAIVLLLLLLSVIARGEVFSSRSLGLLSAVAACCFGEAALFLSLVYWFQLALGAAFAAAFVGLLLWVVRSVIAQANLIKAENDFTI